MWRTAERAVYRQLEPAPALFVKVYQQAAPLEREIAVMRRAGEAGIPVAPLVAFRSGPPAVLVTERVDGVPLSSAYPLAAVETGRLLRCLHALGAGPPFADGQSSWARFVQGSAEREIATMVARGALAEAEAGRLRAHFAALGPLLDRRPCALLHGDCQTDHVLIDPATQHVRAILDFVDAQPGDPLLDIAVLTLWDEALAAPLLAGYGIDPADASLRLLPPYRLLRHLGAAGWLVRHGLPREAGKHDEMVRQFAHTAIGRVTETGSEADDQQC